MMIGDRAFNFLLSNPLLSVVMRLSFSFVSKAKEVLLGKVIDKFL